MEGLRKLQAVLAKIPAAGLRERTDRKKLEDALDALEEAHRLLIEQNWDVDAGARGFVKFKGVPKSILDALQRLELREDEQGGLKASLRLCLLETFCMCSTGALMPTSAPELEPSDAEVRTFYTKMGPPGKPKLLLWLAASMQLLEEAAS
jgi:hypothetical protein